MRCKNRVKTLKSMSDAELKKQFFEIRLKEYARLFSEANKNTGLGSDKSPEKVPIWDEATDIALNNLIVSAKIQGKEEGIALWKKIREETALGLPLTLDKIDAIIFGLERKFQKEAMK